VYGLAIADKPPDVCTRCQDLPSGEWLRFTGVLFQLLPNPLSFDAINSLELSASWYSKTRMAALQSDEGRTMIDSVVWAATIHQRDRHTDSHVAVANAAPTHFVGRQKWTSLFY